MSWRDRFDAAVTHVDARARSGEGWTLSMRAEDSDFVRFNHGRVRQAGQVARGAVSLRWVLGARHASEEVTVGGADDLQRIDAAIARLRALVPHLPEDPHLDLDASPVRSDSSKVSELPGPDDIVAAVTEPAAGHDLVGIYTGGLTHRGFASHLGHSRWQSASLWSLDASVVHEADRAAKLFVGGQRFDPDAIAIAVGEAVATGAVLARPPKRVSPGGYRALLMPQAVTELFAPQAWGGDLGARAVQTGESCWDRLARGTRSLDPRVAFEERTGSSPVAPWQAEGFARPDRVPLVSEGRWVGPVVSPRSAKEYGLTCNGAPSGETVHALGVGPGALPMAEALEALGTGLLVTQLWYTNWSDRAAARLTGLTRFATAWVEGGEVVAPLAVMRFDDSLYDLFGSKLEAITSVAEPQPSTDTYGWRSTDMAFMPGLLVRDFRLTL